LTELKKRRLPDHKKFARGLKSEPADHALRAPVLDAWIPAAVGVEVQFDGRAEFSNQSRLPLRKSMRAAEVGIVR
jgi:hypothetical protein